MSAQRAIRFIHSSLFHYHEMELECIHGLLLHSLLFKTIYYLTIYYLLFKIRN